MRKPTLALLCTQVIRLAELGPLKDSLVGLPGASGLSVEQRKRLTIAVELVANPSELAHLPLPEPCTLVHHQHESPLSAP